MVTLKAFQVYNIVLQIYKMQMQFSDVQCQCNSASHSTEGFQVC